MKTFGLIRGFFLSLLLLLGGFWSWGQCPTGDIVLTTQGQVDSFSINYPGCTAMQENLKITDGSTNIIQNLNGLSALTSIDGDLELYMCDGLVNIEGLGSLTTIGGKFSISHCNLLTTIPELDNLHTIEGDMYLTYNPALTNIDGLESLTNLGGWLRVQSNDALLNLDGLSALTYIGDNVLIEYNNALENLNGFNSLVSTGGKIAITNNNSLLQVNGFSSLNSIGSTHSMFISYNNALENIDGFPQLKKIAYNLAISDNPLLISLLGFNSLDSVGYQIVIDGNINLPGVQGFASLNYIGQDLIIKNNRNLTSLSGIENATSIGRDIEIVENFSLVNLDYFPQITTVQGNLTIQDDTLLTSLSGLGSISSIMGNLRISKIHKLTDLTGLEALQSVGGDISINGNKTITSLNGLETINDFGGTLSISNNLSLLNLVNIPPISSIDDLYIGGNNALIDLTGLEGITTIAGTCSIDDNLALKNFAGLESLSSVNSLRVLDNKSLISFDGLNTISSLAGNLTITYNDSLTNIDAISELVSVGGGIGIYGNDKLSDCTMLALCSKLVTNPFSVNISSNAVGCNTEAEALEACAALNSSSGTIFYDMNCNGNLDGIDIVSPQHILRKVANNTPFIASNESGNYNALFLPNSSTEYTLIPPLGFSVLPESYTITTDTTAQQFPNKDFRLCPDSLFHNLKTTLTSVTVPRPGFTNQYQICAQNLGTQPENATLTLDFSIGPGAQYITITDAAGGSVQNNIITWNISDLQLFDSECFTVTIQLATNTPLGIYLQPTSNVSLVPLQTETKYTDNSVELRDQVVGSYDPNDKTVDMPNITYDPTSGVTRLQYKIRFQNTGTFPATFIEVLDTLESKLDIRTIEMVAASHDYTLSFPSPNVLKWRFENINLPDSSSNEPGSHGFIVFNISTITPINLGEMVQNRAGIYFDFNEPVITNYATTSFTLGVHDPFGLGSLPLSIAPNPTQDNITLRYSLIESADSELLITNAQGVVVQSQRMGKQGKGDYALPVDLAGLPAGLYLVRVRAGEQVGVGKVVRL